ncbi:MAG: hypothetical protein ACOCW2_02930 [Chitinivibrionales bacterium]
MTALVLFAFCVSHACGSTAVVNQRWGEEVSYRTDEAGDILTVSAMFVDSTGIYLHDRASGSLLVYSHESELIGTTTLQPVGRGTYVGDDFIILRDRAIFVNSVDHRLEIFDLLDGSHSRGISIRNRLSGPTRLSRIINRITLSRQTIYIGNTHTMIPFDLSPAKRAASKKTFSTAAHMLIQLIHDQIPVVENITENTITAGEKRFETADSPIPLSGKQYGMAGDKLYGLAVDKTGFSVLLLNKTDT